MKTRRTTTAMHALLSENDALRPLLAKARHIQALQQIYLDALPDLFGTDLPEHQHLAQASRVTAIMGTTIIIGAASASLATRVKQVLPRLLAIFQKQEQKVTEIRVEVQPDWQVRPIPPRPVAREPIPTGHLDILAATLADSPLKDAIAQIRKGRGRSKRSQHE